MKDRLHNKHVIVKRERKHYNVEVYRKIIADLDWGDFFETQQIDILNNMFEEFFLSVLNDIAPVKISQRRKNFISWVSDTVKEEMRLRDRLRDKARSSQSREDWTKYKVSRNKCVKLLRESKKHFYQNLYNKIEQETDTKSLYSLSNELINRTDRSSPQQFVVNGTLLRKPSEMANMQMDYYVKKVMDILKNISGNDRNPHRFLDHALQSWEGRNRVPVFEFREVSLI